MSPPLCLIEGKQNAATRIQYTLLNDCGGYSQLRSQVSRFCTDDDMDTLGVIDAKQFSTLHITRIATSDSDSTLPDGA